MSSLLQLASWSLPLEVGNSLFNLIIRRTSVMLDKLEVPPLKIYQSMGYKVTVCIFAFGGINVVEVNYIAHLHIIRSSKDPYFQF